MKLGLGLWKSLLLLLIIYLVKEIVRLIVENEINKRKNKEEIQYKYAEKLLDKKVPVYIEHYSFLKQSIGIYKHIVENYNDFNNWNDKVYDNLKNNKIYDFKDSDKAYRESVGYRTCENLSHYISVAEDFKIKSMNKLSLNQLFINDRLIEKSNKINNLIDKELTNLIKIRDTLEEQYELTNEEFLELFNKEMTAINSEIFIKEIERYLEKVKSEFYIEYNVEKQKDYI
ncbi:hypothetical protein [Staphylococcus croceilyticus]|uniref:hypothetical protein n=1 Tax=Staphylococcus croceilyticus TaxID=319942 RepID=UPI001E31245E|nr:hypothetical protein [Staphylococcus croceilyticus]